MTKLQYAFGLADFILDEMAEHTCNDMPEVPKPKQTAGADIKKALVNPDSSVKKFAPDPIDNDMPHEPDPKKVAAQKLKKALAMT